MPTGIPVKATGQQLSASEFNIVNDLLNSVETAANSASASATSAQNTANTASATAASALAAAQNATTSAQNAASDATSAGLKADGAQDAVDALAVAVAANTAKRSVPTATPPGGYMFDDGANITTVPGGNAYLASPDDDALIAAVGTATWSNNVATITGWGAGRRYKDATYVYEAFSDNTVTRIAIQPAGGVGGATDITVTASPIGVTIASSSGTGDTIPLADATNAGAMPPAQFSKVASAIPVSVTGVQPGDLFQYDDVSQGLIRVPYDAQPDAVTTFNLNSVVGSVYGYTNPCTAASYTIANAEARGTAIARIQNNTPSGPSFSLSGGTVVKQGDWATGWDTSGVNHVQLLAVTDTLVWAYIIA